MTICRKKETCLYTKRPKIKQQSSLHNRILLLQVATVEMPIHAMPERYEGNWECGRHSPQTEIRRTVWSFQQALDGLRDRERNDDSVDLLEAID